MLAFKIIMGCIAAGIMAVCCWALCRAAAKADNAMQQQPSLAHDNTYTAHLVEQLLKQDKVQSMTVKRQGSVEVLDKDGGGVRFGFGPAVAIIVPLFEGEENAVS